MIALAGRRPAVLQSQTGSVYTRVILGASLCLAFAGILAYASYLKQWLVASPELPTAVVSQPSSQGRLDYLAIREWGVKLPVQGVLRDARYQLEDVTVYLTTSSIVDVDPGCGKQYTLARSKSKPTANDNGVISEGGQYGGILLTKIGAYYYRGIEAQASCADPKNVTSAEAQLRQQQLQLEVRDAYMTAAKHLSAL